MAQKAKKDRAKANASALTSLHLGTVSIHAFFLMTHFMFRRRSLLAYGILSIPSFVCEFILEKSGRPKFDPETKALRASGEDLAAPGLTEYMFDVVWVTWISIMAVIIFGNWAWLLWAAIPAYGLYLGSGLFGMGRQQMANMAQMQQGQQEAAPQGNRRSRRAA